MRPQKIKPRKRPIAVAAKIKSLELQLASDKIMEANDKKTGEDACREEFWEGKKDEEDAEREEESSESEEESAEREEESAEKNKEEAAESEE